MAAIIFLSTPRSGITLLRECLGVLGLSCDTLITADVVEKINQLQSGAPFTVLSPSLSEFGLDSVLSAKVVDDLWIRYQAYTNSNQIHFVLDNFFLKLLPLWSKKLKSEKFCPSYLIIVRHPAEVAQSLLLNDGIYLDDGYKIWISEVLTIIGCIGESTYSIVSFDQILADPSGLIRIISDLSESPFLSPSEGPIEDNITKLYQLIQPCLKSNNAPEGACLSNYHDLSVELYRHFTSTKNQLSDLGNFDNKYSDSLCKILSNKQNTVNSDALLDWYQRGAMKFNNVQKINIARALTPLGAHDLSRHILQDVISLDNNNVRALAELAELDQLSGQYNAAIDTWTRLLNSKDITSGVRGNAGRKLVRAQLKVAERTLSHNFNIYYRPDTRCYLAQLCDEHGSDKGSLTSAGHCYLWPPHTYTDFYSRIFHHWREDVKSVFECGLGTNNTDIPSNMTALGRPGASLRVWRDYFPNANIFGADIDKDCLFFEDRINTYYVDQTDPVSVSELWSTIGVENFDFILDDGLHIFDAGITLFENSIKYLSHRGVYIIEDIKVADLLKYQDYFKEKRFLVEYVNCHRPNTPLGDNTLIVIRNSLS